MCGIIGYVGPRNAVPVVVEGLARLEYRGYDSAGVAVVADGGLSVFRRAGRVASLVESLPALLEGGLGIGHTRWATHGEASDRNAHPHLDASGHVAVVHNGIIENANELRATFLPGVEFSSETDTEVLAHLIALQDDGPLEERVRGALCLVEGTYGLAVIDDREPDRIVVARNGSPVLLGIGDGEQFVASDASAIVRFVRQVVYLEDREIAVLTAGGFSTMTLDATPTSRTASAAPVSVTAYDLAGHVDYMHKEIFEQPTALETAVRGRFDHAESTAHLGGIDLSAREVLGLRRVRILGCGSAYYAGIGGAHLIEALARIPAEAETASEFRYRNPIIEPDTLYVAVSQSGETFDTLAAVREIRRRGGRVLGIVNTPGSTIARECGTGVFLRAGPELSVASTKTFTSTLVAFSLLALHFGRIKDLGASDGARLGRGLEALPDAIRSVLEDEESIAVVAKQLAAASDAFYIGRVDGHLVALEGAQKLKEIAYVHAEAYPAAELKHGPLALISEETPTVVIIPDDELFEKNLASIAEIRARRGPVIAVTDSAEAVPGADWVIAVPRVEPELRPVIFTVPLQLLAYHAAGALSRDVDRPRNLAKSVTVE